MQAVSFRLHSTVLFSQGHLTLCCGIVSLRVQQFLHGVFCISVLVISGQKTNTCGLDGFILWVFLEQNSQSCRSQFLAGWW